MKSEQIKVAMLVGEFFSNSLPFQSGKGGYGMIARHYLTEYIPNQDIQLDTIVGFNNKNELLVHVVDGKKNVLFLPSIDQNPSLLSRIVGKIKRTISKTSEQAEVEKNMSKVIDNYDVFISIEFQDIAYEVMLRASRQQKLVIWVQDPRPQSDWDEIDSASMVNHRTGYRPNDKFRRLMKSLFESNRLVGISQGKFLMEKARDLYDLPDSFEIDYVPNPIEIPEIDDSELHDKENTIIAIGRLDSVKRPWVIGEIAKRLPEYKFVFAGQYHEKDMESVMQPYFELENVSHAGHLEGDEKDDLFRKSKLLVNTSIHEAIPVTFLESLAYGNPIVSCRNPDDLVSTFGFYTGVTDGDGFSEVDNFVIGIRELIENDDRRIAIARKGIEYVNTYHGIDSFINDVRQVLIDSA